MHNARSSSVAAALALSLASFTLNAQPAAKAQAARSSAPTVAGPESATAQAPDTFKVKFATSKGDFAVEVHRDWSPRGADRFFNLVKAGYFNGVRFFRVVAGFMVQFGIHGTPEVNARWKAANIPDDAPGKASNERGMVSFATSGPDTRTTQVFINFGDNKRLDAMGFTPFAKVIKGMEVVDKLHAGYGEGAPSGRGPTQDRIDSEGNAYLAKEFPQLDFIKKASIIK